MPSLRGGQKPLTHGVSALEENGYKTGWVVQSRYAHHTHEGAVGNGDHERVAARTQSADAQDCLWSMNIWIVQHIGAEALTRQMEATLTTRNSWST